MEATSAVPEFEEGSQAEQDRRALQSMVEYLCTTTRADRCVATLNAGSPGVLRASAGLAILSGSAADPFAILREQCLHSGKLVDCEDVASDKRLNAEACRGSGIGAFVAAPVTLNSQARGVVEMHSAQAFNFMQYEIEVLQRVADAIGALICK
jgi:GAF domain-containing protein